MTAAQVATINSQLIVAREELAVLQSKVDAARGVSERATTGGLTGYDSAVLSGIQRKANPRRTARRFAAYDRESALAVQLVATEHQVKLLERRLADAITERDRTRFTRDDIVGATHIVDRFGKLRTVVRVNQKTVSVTTEWSWTETVPFDKVRAVKR